MSVSSPFLTGRLEDHPGALRVESDFILDAPCLLRIDIEIDVSTMAHTPAVVQSPCRKAQASLLCIKAMGYVFPS